MIAKHINTQIGDFAIAIEAGNGHAKVVVVGSAGHIASMNDPGADLFSPCSNAQWTLNMIEWLINA